MDDGRSKQFLETRVNRGKSKRAALRLLKTYIAGHEKFLRLCADLTSSTSHLPLDNDIPGSASVRPPLRIALSWTAPSTASPGCAEVLTEAHAQYVSLTRRSVASGPSVRGKDNVRTEKKPRRPETIGTVLGPGINRFMSLRTLTLRCTRKCGERIASVSCAKTGTS
jgi:hypothetical protein